MAQLYGEAMLRDEVETLFPELVLATRTLFKHIDHVLAEEGRLSKAELANYYRRTLKDSLAFFKAGGEGKMPAALLEMFELLSKVVDEKLHYHDIDARMESWWFIDFFIRAFIRMVNKT